MDPFTYRKIMSQWPTGVCVVTGLSETGVPLGMIIGSFCSVSLDPPLVAFFVKNASTTWSEIQRRDGAFCVNILSHRQSGLCSTFASGDPNRRFDQIAYESNPDGAPRLLECCAWIDARCDKTVELGDHLMVVGRVLHMHQGVETTPLIFSKGRLNRTEPLTTLSEDHFLLWEDSLQVARAVWSL